MRTSLKVLFARIITWVSPYVYINLSYFYSRGSFPNLKKPKNISEIILSNIYTGKINVYSKYVDKINVREIYESWGYSQFLPKLYGVWNNVNEIDFSTLPKAFALKTNHGCGHHYICSNKGDLDITKAKDVLNNALQTKFGLTETQYHSINPLVFCEEYIDNKTGHLPDDYKFICLDGEIKCILIVTERTETSYKLITYNTKWEKLNYVVPYYNAKNDFPQPKNLPTMINLANQICQRFEFVRVDFYDIGDHVYLGELTFTPQGGIMSYFTKEALVIMGRS